MAVLAPIRQLNKVIEHEVVVREFPQGTEIHVAVGDIVTPETILAQYQSARGFRVFHIATALNVKGSEVGLLLKRKIGTKIYAGEVLAEKERLGGWQKNIFRAPVDGTIQSISPKGDVTISMLPHQSSQASIFWGKVVGISDGKDSSQLPSVSIETQYIQVSGVMGSGRKREGYLSVVCEASDFLLPHRIDESAGDSIIVCGALVEKSVLEVALHHRASGIIAGGIHLKDAAAMGIKKPEEVGQGTDVGVSLLISEGFGPATINQEQFAIMQKYNGRYSVIDGNAGFLAIPLRPEEVTEVSATKGHKVTKPVPLQVGLLARVVQPSDFGMIGKVAAVLEDEQALPNGQTCKMVRLEQIDKQGTMITVPADNVEIVG